MSAWRLLDMPAADAAHNMAVDTVLLRQQGCGSPPTLRLYRWLRPALTLGYGLTAETSLSLAGCTTHGIDVARRLTGGGVVVHSGAVTFSIAASSEETRLPATAAGLHRLAMGLARTALADVGVVAEHAGTRLAPDDRSANWCWARPSCHDLVTSSGKIAGGADRRTSWATLYQGYVRVAESYAGDALCPEGAPLPVAGDTESVDGELVLAGIARAFENAVGRVRRGQLSPDEAEAARQVATAYRSPAWVWGDRAAIRRIRRDVELAPGT